MKLGHYKNFIESVIAIKKWFSYGFFAQLTCGYFFFVFYYEKAIGNHKIWEVWKG